MEEWEQTTLGDLCEFRRGLTYKKADEVDLSHNAVLRANNITVETGEINFDEIRYIREDIEIPDKKKLVPGSLLVCTASGSKKHLGKIGIVTEDIDFAFGGFMALLLPQEQADAKYLFWYTRSNFYRDFISDLSDGVNINNLKWSQLSELPIPLPPLPEQERIVAILDEAFVAIETATAHTEKNLANARELFESQLARAFSGGDSGGALAIGWEKKTLDELCEIARGGSPRPIKEFITDEESGINWIKIGDATASSKYIYETKQKIKPDGVRRSRMVHPGDFLLSNSMSFGRPYIMKTSGCIHDGWLVLSDKSGLFNQDYLYHFLGSTAAYKQFDSRAAGSTVRNLNIDSVRTVEVLLPPLPEQERIVAILDEAFAQSKQLEQISTDKLDHLTNLKQSLLHKAFTGELTADKKAVDRTLSEAGL